MADGPKPTIVTSVPHGGQLWQARFNPAGDMLCAAAYDATVRRWRVAGSELTELGPLTGHQGWVQTIAFTPDGGRLLSADSWGRLSCWDYRAARARAVAAGADLDPRRGPCRLDSRPGRQPRRSHCG